jgi:hypothetical protein
MKLFCPRTQGMMAWAWLEYELSVPLEFTAVVT